MAKNRPCQLLGLIGYKESHLAAVGSVKNFIKHRCLQKNGKYRIKTCFNAAEHKSGGGDYDGIHQKN